MDTFLRNVMVRYIFLLLLLVSSSIGQITDIPITGKKVQELPFAINANYNYTLKYTSGTSIPGSCTSTLGYSFYKMDSHVWYDCVNNSFVPRNGASSTVVVDTFANLGTPSDGTIQYCTDCPYTFVRTSSTWNTFLNGTKVIPPALSGKTFTVLTGSGSFTTTHGVLTLTDPVGAGFTYVGTDLPQATDYTVIFGIGINAEAYNYSSTYTFVSDISGTVSQLGLVNAGVQNLEHLKETSWTNFVSSTGANQQAMGLMAWGRKMFYVKIVNTAGSRVWYLSWDDKLNWIPYITDNTSFTDAKVGISSNSNGSTPVYATLYDIQISVP